MKIHRIAGWRRWVACVLVPGYVAACTVWHEQGVAPEQVVARDHPKRVLVTRLDSSRLVLRQPRVAGDRLLGVSAGVEVGVPLADVAHVAVSKVHPAKTTMVGLTIVGMAVVIGSLFAAAFGGSNIYEN
ncbi:MAG: hypothetical protein ACREL9_05390 [Gemmatimonadales bacterium]